MNLKVLLILSLGHLVTDITQGGLPILLPFIKETLNLSYAAAGAIIMAGNITSSIIQPFLGYLSDRWGGIWMLPVGVAVSCAGFSVLGFAPSYAYLLVAVLISGLGVASYHPEGFKVAQYFTGDRKVTGMSFFAVGGSLGYALGPLLAVYSYRWMGLKGTVLFAVPGLLMAVILLTVMPNLLASQRGESSDRVRREASTPRPLGSRWIPLTFLILAVTMRSWVQMGLVAFIPFYFVNILNGDPIRVGKLISVFLIAGAFGTLLGAPVADRFGPKRFFVVSMALMTPLLWLFMQVEGLWLYIVLGLVGAVLVSTFSVTIVMAQQILPDRLGVASGLMVGFAIGTGGIGATFLGWLADYWGVTMVLRLTAWLPLIGMLFTLCMPYPPRFAGSVSSER
jgi:FSR family fosmidomycin resistance protein-like MFS transporter